MIPDAYTYIALALTFILRYQFCHTFSLSSQTNPLIKFSSVFQDLILFPKLSPVRPFQPPFPCQLSSSIDYLYLTFLYI